MAIQRTLGLGALLLTVLVVAPSSIAKTQKGRRPPAVKRSPQENSAPPASPAPKNSVPPASQDKPTPVSFKDGRLSVSAWNRTVAIILEEISREAPVAIVRADGVGDDRVSMSFQNLPLEEGLRKILKDYDAFFFYGAEKEAPAALKAVWVYPKGKAQGFAPVPPEMWASTKELEPMLADPDPQVRYRAIESLIDRKRDKAIELVLKALRDNDDMVRAQTLYAATSRGLEVPVDTLRGLILDDPSADVRFIALDAMANHPEAGQIAEMMLNDPSPFVQEKAQEILHRLKKAHRPPGADKPSQQQAKPQDP